MFGNAYEYSNGAYKYLQNYYATLYRTYAGQHQWFTAPSGTAGNAITFTQAMTLDASGDVVIGDTTTNSIRFSIAKNNPTRGILAHIYNIGSSSQTGAQIQFTQNGIANWAIGQPAGEDAFAFWSGRNTATNGAERARIDSSGNLLVGTTSAGTGAIVDVQSTTKGVRFPNMTTTQKNAITPAAGTVVFDTTLAKLCVYSGSAWQTITSV